MNIISIGIMALSLLLLNFQNVFSSTEEKFSETKFMKIIENRNNEYYVISNDGGKTWVKQQMFNKGTPLINKLIFRNYRENRDGVIWYSDDYAKTWTKLSPDPKPKILEIGNIFPNPSNNNFHLEIYTNTSNEKLKLTVLSLDGNIVFEMNEVVTDNKSKLSIDNLSVNSGIYILTIQKGNVTDSKLIYLTK